MRLLNTESLCLIEFKDEDKPTYAILSHTWGKEEISFQEMQKMQKMQKLDDGVASQKAGYNKIKGSCRMAQNKQYEWIWIDTCCIDKGNSTELSEAINSMYCWYQEADVCFAYLEDVLPNKTTFQRQIDKSRWFSRGWTLQELVAPRKVEFFAGDWTFLCSKADIAISLSSITGIHPQALADKPLKAFSVAQKMSWASKRTTTKPEDIAYCLLGLFNVNMPLLYGEGMEKAFVRLQEEIMKDSDDQSIFAWNRPGEHPEALHSLLAATPADFANSTDIVPVRDWGKSSPFSVTNAGLHFTIRKGLLSCFSEKDPDQLVALHFLQECRLSLTEYI
ncbi:heterokaryon incompatibility protein-domain-containing protein [Leptodontidium sp. MPI-SDFR-AT-0119]|nr:heterokaryon incompatibility protein-domain-containing protein [Leptodontidium sp. MPI-SDFR-AT-0119]